jgi:hypothetical protein
VSSSVYTTDSVSNCVTLLLLAEVMLEESLLHWSWGHREFRTGFLCTAPLDVTRHCVVRCPNTGADGEAASAPEVVDIV